MSGVTTSLVTAWDTRGTVVPHGVHEDGSARQTLVDAHPARGVSAPAGIPPILRAESDQFELGEVIGRGGMGVVFSARQPGLGREVAVKMPRTDLPPGALQEAVARLLGEALTIGALEHPNIVPVHVLGCDSDARPAIVMKRIGGESWGAALARDLARAGPLRGESLARHLDVLAQVATAVHYAHARGVIHRDLKPDNVMLGTFGETYVLDWGLAARLGPNGPAHIPTVADIQTVFGTPAYMAPEMAAGTGDAISARTDVYLLGAILHELLTGRPPHDYPRIMDALVSAFEARPPSFAPDVPPGLAEVCRRALSRDPAARFADAGELRAALVRARETHASVALTQTAQGARAALDAIRARGALGAAEHERIRGHFAEARLGFVEAMRSWPENVAARAGLQDVLEAMIGYELARGAPAAAALLLAELPEQRPALSATIARAEAEAESEHAALRRLAWDRSMEVGARIRTQLLLVVAATWLLAWGTGYALLRAGFLTRPHRFAELFFVTMLALGIVVPWAVRKRFLKNAINRGLALVYVFGYASYAVHVGVCDAVGVPFPTTMGLMMLLAATLWGATCALGERSFIAPAVATALCACLDLALPELTFVWSAVLMPLGLVAYVLLDRRRERSRVSEQPFSRVRG